jgi:hypothetical protein
LQFAICNVIFGQAAAHFIVEHSRRSESLTSAIRGSARVSTGVQYPVPHRHAGGQSRTAVRFFLLASGAFGIALSITVGLSLLFGRPNARPEFRVPPSFANST